MSISVEDPDIVLDYILSPSNVTSPQVGGNSNDGPDNYHPSGGLTLDSFIPIIKQLPGVYLDQNAYYIHGSISTDYWTGLRDYAKRVSKFILTDANKQSQARISHAAFLRLARNQLPLLPSLSDLVIVNADASIAYLELLLTPSLKSLKASCIPDAQQSTFFSFLTALEQEAPLFQTLILGPGHFEPSSLQIISQFDNLRHLELKNDDSEIPFAFFDNIGSLPKLETLILDARYVSGTLTKNQSNSITEPTSPSFKSVNPLPSDNSSDFNLMDGKSDEDSAGDTHLAHTPISTSGTFKRLTKFHVIGWLPLLEDLIPRIMSTTLEDVSITLNRLTLDELLTKAKADEEERKRDEAEREAEREAAREAAREAERQAERVAEMEAERRAHMWGISQRKHPIRVTTIEEMRLRVEENRIQEEQMQLQEQESLRQTCRISFNTHTGSFTQLLRTLYRRWPTSLKVVSVSQLPGRSFQQLLKSAGALPEDIFRELLLLPAIESLEVKGWGLNSVESVINVAESMHKLKSLLLPLDESNSGISLSTLRHVAKTCPKLESFQCRIEPLSMVPEYGIPTTEALTHGLRTLSVGNSSPLPNPKQLHLIARHLYLLFPNLESIHTSKAHNGEQWDIVDESVKMRQTARLDDMYRLSATVTQ